MKMTLRLQYNPELLMGGDISWGTEVTSTTDSTAIRGIAMFWGEGGGREWNDDVVTDSLSGLLHGNMHANLTTWRPPATIIFSCSS
jgi:hypothetical protein